MRPPNGKSSSISPLASSLAFVISAYALLALVFGWGFGLDALVRDASTQSAMVPATALAFVMTGVALLTASAGYKRLTFVLCAAALILCGLTAFTQMSDLPHLMQLIFFEVGESEHMAPLTAVSFALAVFAITQLEAGRFFIVNCVGIFGLSTAGSILILKNSGTYAAYEIGVFSGMSLQTASLFCLLFLSMCLTTLGPTRR